MLGLFGYNFCSDGNSVDPAPTHVTNVTSTRLQNAIYDDFYITKDVTSEYSTDVPTTWDFNTILLANFNGNLSAGSISKVIDKLSAISVKRREVGTFEWMTIKEYPVFSAGDLSFSFIDALCKNDTIYEYAWVPVLKNGTEGNYIITEVLSKFNGVYLADVDSVYKFMANVGYGQTQRVQQVGTFEPYGRRYPVYVSNGMTNYEQGSVNATLVGNYLENHTIDRNEIVKEKKSLFDFLTNKKAKILKDYNGNYWLVVITGNPSVDYVNNYGMGIMNANFQWSEIGDADNPKDMKSAGLTL